MCELDALRQAGRAAGVGQQDDVVGRNRDGGRLVAGEIVVPTTASIPASRAASRAWSMNGAVVTTSSAPESRSWCASSPTV
jgi:hypothetical protein